MNEEEMSNAFSHNAALTHFGLMLTGEAWEHKGKCE